MVSRGQKHGRAYFAPYSGYLGYMRGRQAIIVTAGIIGVFARDFLRVFFFLSEIIVLITRIWGIFDPKWPFWGIFWSNF